MNFRLVLRCAFVAVLLVVPVVASAGQPGAKSWKGLQRMMSPAEFHSAGLDRLSPEQLSRLNRWFLHFLAYDSEQVVRTDKTVQALQKVPTRHRILGNFRGWSGHTLFRLDDGEVWKQRLPDEYFVRLKDPEVEIYKNLMGFYELKVVKTGRRIGVTRVK